MTQHKFSILLFSSLLLVWSSCKKDDKQYHISDAQSPVLTANTASISLDPDNQTDTVLTFKWNHTSFGTDIAVTYSLELDLASDTSGSDAWGKATSITLGNTDSTYTYTGQNLNYLLANFNVTAGTEAALVARIKAIVAQNTGENSKIAPVYSNATVTSVLTYSVDMFVPGSYQGWDPLTAPTIALINGYPGLFECYVYFSGTSRQTFKYTSKRDFAHIVYGDNGSGGLDTAANADSMSVPTGGYYELTANLNDGHLAWTAVPTTWGIIGDATPGGWSNDTPLTYDTATQTWKVTANMITAGSFKFRANGQWVIDFGVDAAGNLMYADNPFFGYNGSLNNITVPEDGNYTITLDLHVPGKYTYTAVKN